VAGRAKTQAWKAWLKTHGKSDVPVPALERIDRASFENLIRDPATERDVIDYAQFTGDTIADAVLGFAAKTRALIPKQRQIGMFFGYILELTGSRMVWAGHLEYERLYQCAGCTARPTKSCGRPCPCLLLILQPPRQLLAI